MKVRVVVVRVACFVCVVACSLYLGCEVLAEAFRIEASHTNEAVRVELPSSSNAYYTIHGSSVHGDGDEAWSTVHMVLGEVGSHWQVSTKGDGPPVGYFRARRVPIVLPEDGDGDGIDDAYELRHPFLDPLSSSDALEDPDADQFDNLEEYLAGSDPLAAESTPLRVQQPGYYEERMGHRVDGVEALVELYLQRQADYQPLLPPGSQTVVVADTLVRPTDWAAWPAAIRRGLAPRSVHGLPVDEVWIRKERAGPVCLENGGGERLAEFPSSPCSGAAEEDCSRLVLVMQLVDVDVLERYLWNEQAHRRAAAEAVVPLAAEVVQVASVRPSTEGVALTVTYPAEEIGSRWEVYAFSVDASGVSEGYEGMTSKHQLVAAGVMLTGQTHTTWIDRDAFAMPELRYYALGRLDADQDKDGLSEGAERFVYKTDPALADSDGDGVVDGEEVVRGRDPLDGSDHARVSGRIEYSGMQTGVIRLIAAEVDAAWSAGQQAEVAAPGAFTWAGVSPGSYWLKAYMDVDGNGLRSEEEASGTYAFNPVNVTGDLTGVVIHLLEADSDADGLSDYEERIRFRSNPHDASDPLPQFRTPSAQVWLWAPLDWRHELCLWFWLFVGCRRYGRGLDSGRSILSRPSGVLPSGVLRST